MKNPYAVKIVKSTEEMSCQVRLVQNFSAGETKDAFFKKNHSIELWLAGMVRK